MTLSSFQSLAPRTPLMDLRVALIIHRTSPSLPAHSFLPTLFVYFLPISPTPPALPPPPTLYLQASSEHAPSKLSHPLFKNELFLLTPLTLLLASTSLIHSTHSLVATTVYSSTKASSTFWNHHPHCVWTSCENTMTLHSPATPALPEPVMSAGRAKLGS